MPMNAQQREVVTLKARLRSPERRVIGDEGSASWGELAERCPSLQMLHRCVMVRTTGQLTTVAALIALDGVARRVVICPPDTPEDQLEYLTEAAEVDFLVPDGAWTAANSSLPYIRLNRSTRGDHSAEQGLPTVSSQDGYETEWVLLTSGTTGKPKLVVHTLSSLADGIAGEPALSAPVVWSTFYDIRRYGGLQIFLRAALSGASLVLSSAKESTAEFLMRAGANDVTHISGTPSHWRRALMTTSASKISPKYVRLSGEVADQTLLDQLRLEYPTARIAHAFASTEAGVAFDVTDGLMGVPADRIGLAGEIETKLEGCTLRVRSPRNALRYLGQQARGVKEADGFVDTGDVLELRDGRYYFQGRRDGTINVGGLKVHPEEVEAVLNGHPEVSVSLVRSKQSAIVGGLVIADIVLRTRDGDPARDRSRRASILDFCREVLPPYKVPALINFVPVLALNETGKLVRPHA